MDVLRNISSQSFIVRKQGGGNMHLLPGRAITLSAEELKSPQVQQLLNRGFAQVEKLGMPEKAAPLVAKGEKRSEKKKSEN